MKVHLTGSSSSPGEDMPYLRCIVETLHKNNVSIVLNWVEAAYNVSSGKADRYWSWGEIIENNLDAIDNADAVIIEGTSHGFLQGFQVSRALIRRLPILFVSRETITSHPISGISNRLLDLYQYKAESELKKIISDFIEKNKSVGDQLKLSEKAKHYIRGESLVSGKSELEIVDSLLSGKFN